MVNDQLQTIITLFVYVRNEREKKRIALKWLQFKALAMNN